MNQLLIVSPIVWQATHNDAVITEIRLSEKDSVYWFQKYAHFLAEENLKLTYQDPNIWLLDAWGKPSLNAKPVHQLFHQSLMPELRQLDPSVYWQKRITESQMFFASFNDAPMNGVWFWRYEHWGLRLHRTLLNLWRKLPHAD